MCSLPPHTHTHERTNTRIHAYTHYILRIQVLKDLGVPLTSNQIQYSLLCRQQETNGALQMAKRYNVITLAYSPLAQGILTDKYTESSVATGPRTNGWRAGGNLKNTLSRAQNLLAVMREISYKRDKTPAQIALNWCICKGTVPIPGARTRRQATENGMRVCIVFFFCCCCCC